MAYNKDVTSSDTFVAASAVGQYVAVKMLALASYADKTCVPGETSADDILGITHEAPQPTYGQPVGVALNGVVKAIAAAAIYAGQLAAVASTNGALGPIIPSGLPAVATGNAASGAYPLSPSGYVQIAGNAAVLPKFSIGRALTSAAVGELFSVHIDRREII